MVDLKIKEMLIKDGYVRRETLQCKCNHNRKTSLWLKDGVPLVICQMENGDLVVYCVGMISNQLRRQIIDDGQILYSMKESQTTNNLSVYVFGSYRQWDKDPEIIDSRNVWMDFLRRMGIMVPSLVS